MKIKKKSVGITTTTSNKSESFYKTFPYELTHQDGDAIKTCWFCDDYDMNKYIERHKINKKESKIVIHSKSCDSLKSVHTS